MNVILCGMPGAGKSVTAFELCKLSGKKAVDTDAIIVERHGNIAQLFEKFGEKYFRDIETEACKSLASLDGLIIATGGGLVLRRQNVDLLKRNGVIIYLKAQKQTLISRVNGSCDRPLLLGNVEERITRLLDERASVYESVADIIIETDNLTPNQTAKKILDILKDKI